MVDIIFVIIELFRYLLRLRCYKRKTVEVSISRRGVGHLERKFQRERGIAHQPLLVSENEWLQYCAVSKYLQCTI